MIGFTQNIESGKTIAGCFCSDCGNSGHRLLMSGSQIGNAVPCPDCSIGLSVNGRLGFWDAHNNRRDYVLNGEERFNTTIEERQRILDWLASSKRGMVAGR